ncbi:MAG: hypothetical protein FD149_1484 [Rhodospirillaceae bacterium]|nr:MAG: hypothetical protein FD149_1484 [Rhodospirillaceae bacterium]
MAAPCNKSFAGSIDLPHPHIAQEGRPPPPVNPMVKGENKGKEELRATAVLCDTLRLARKLKKRRFRAETKDR